MVKVVSIMVNFIISIECRIVWGVEMWVLVVFLEICE